jgi:hypothetical protein
MKKTCLIALAIFTAYSVCAQTTKGNWLVGGQAGFSSAKEKGSNVTNSIIEFLPDAGYFFANNFAAGASLGYTGLSTKANGNKSTSSVVEFGPFIRYYITGDDKLKLFAQGHAAWGSIDFGGGGGKTSTSSYGFKAGPAIFLNRNVALEITAGYKSSRYKEGGQKSTRGDINMGIGFQVHLNKAG